MKRILTLLILTASTLAARAGSDTVTKHLNIDNGLTNNFILNIALDGLGYAWIGTEEGLNRIAGNTCNTFRQAETPETSTTGITGNAIRSIYYDATTDKVFVATEFGLSIYDCKAGSFKNFTKNNGLSHSEVCDVVGAGEGLVWLLMGNGQVVKMDCANYQMTKLELKDTHSIRSGMADGKGHLYIGHKHSGLTIVDLKTLKTKRFTEQEGTPGSLPGNNVRSICQDSRGNVWVGTNHGLARYNPATGTFTKARHQGLAYDDNVFCIRELSDGRLWVASDMGGLCLIDLQQPGISTTEDIVFLTDCPVKATSLNTRAIVEDEFGNIWVGNHSTGIDFFAAQKSLFSTVDFHDADLTQKRIYSVGRDEAGNLWLGGEDELALYRDGQVVKSWPVQGKRSHAHSYVYCILPDRSGTVWLGMEDEGVVRFDPRSQHFSALDLGVSGIDIRSFFEDKNGKLWIGSEHGIYSYADGKVTKENKLNDIVKSDVMSSINQSASGQILIGTQAHGFYIIDPVTLDHKNLNTSNGLPSNSINHVFVDHQQGVWLATKRGLAYIRNLSQLGDIKVYGQQNGLADTHTRAIQQDGAGRIWVSTYSDINCFDAKRDRFYNYSHTSNLPSGSFVAGSATTMTDGTMFFGSPNGVCCFNPQLLNVDDSVSAVQIVLFQAYNPAGDDTEILNLVPDARGRVYTNYRQNTLHLAFTVKDYAQTNFVEYSYMMSGLNDKWYYIDDDYDVVFRGLSPGHYTFTLRAKLKNQDWNEASTTKVDIYIAPPFWLTWWAFVIYALLAAGLTWYFIRSYKHRLQLSNSLQLEQLKTTQIEEINEERMRFFTNVTHELSAPLSLILGPLEDMTEDTRLPEDSQKKIKNIFSSTQRLNNLINDLLEFRKTETHGRQLTVERGELGPVIKEIGNNFKELNRNANIRMHLIVRPGLPLIYFDREVITTIVTNFLSNAFKYTEEGTVNIIVNSDENGYINVSVADTGCGIAPEALPHIFERYYQVKADSQQPSGTGIGLTLVRTLADLHEAKLNVESTVGKGSKFTLSLLIDNDYPTAQRR